MRKFVSLAAVFVLLATLTTACTPSGQSSSSSVGAGAGSADAEAGSIIIGSYPDPANNQDPTNAKWVELYKKISEKTNVDITLQVIPADQVESKLVTTNMAGSPSADMYMMSSQKTASVVSTGSLLPLDDYIEKDMDQSKYQEATFDDGTYNDHIYCVLSSIHCRGLWYNKNLMPTPPKTQDELIRYAKEATDVSKGIFGFGFYGTNDYGSMEVSIGPEIWDAGGSLCDEKGNASWADNAAVQGIQFFSRCLNIEKISPKSCVTNSNYSDIASMFTAGQLACYIDGTYALSTIQQSQLYKDGKVGFVPIPGKNGPAPNFSNGWAFAIPSNSKKADLCWKVIQAFEQSDIQIEHSSFEGGLPTTKESYTDPLFSNPIYQAFQDNMKNARSMDPFINYQQGLTAISTVKTSYLLDPGKDLNKLLQDAQDQFNKQYGD